MKASAAAIVDIRNRLLGDHCGVSADDVAAADATRFAGAAVDRLSGNGHRLGRDRIDGEPEPSELAEVVARVADPESLWRRRGPGPASAGASAANCR